MHRNLLITALAAALVALPGCARVSDAAVDRPTGTSAGASDGDVVTQRVSADFGAQVLAEQHVVAGVSGIDALRATTTVDTAFGGGFVAGMYGRGSDVSGHRDWFFFVNGIAPGIGAGDYTLRRGDRIWWDYRSWGGGPSLPAVVGSWPEPFVHGYPSAPDHVQADPPLARVLRDAGAAVSADPGAWRVIVGANDDLIARDPVWRRAMAGPARAGLAVRIGGGGAIRVLGMDGRTMVDLPSAAAIAALVLTGSGPEDGGALLAVAGLDAAAADAAARRIARDPAVLTGRVAVAFDHDGEPIAIAGREIVP